MINEEELDKLFDEDKLKRLGLASIGIYQVGIYESADAVWIVRSHREAADTFIKDSVVKTLLWHDKLDLTKASALDEDFLKKLALEIVTRKYPVPPMWKYLLKLRDNPKELETQAYVNACENSDCLCSLFFSTGCLQILDNPIEGLYTPYELINRTFFRLLANALRQTLSPTQMKGLLEEAKETKDLEDGLLRTYDERRKTK